MIHGKRKYWAGSIYEQFERYICCEFACKHWEQVFNVVPPKALPSAEQYWYSVALLGFKVPASNAFCSGRQVLESEHGNDVEVFEELGPGDEKRQTSTA